MLLIPLIIDVLIATNNEYILKYNVGGGRGA